MCVRTLIKMPPYIHRQCAQIYIMYERELSHKQWYLEARRRDQEPCNLEPSDQIMPWRAVSLVTLLAASYAAAEAAARWAPPYQCGAQWAAAAEVQQGPGGAHGCGPP